MKVQINYKSRKSITFECDYFLVKRNGPTVSYEWAGAKPNALLIGVNDIESVWEL